MQQTKIGVVEDEIIIADSIRSVLRGMDYAVPEPCCDYDEAIAMLQQERPDLVLLDINLGGSEQDGIAVAKYIRENLQMPLIFLTANSDAGTVARAKAVTPDAFLVKPFQKDDLYAAIEIAIHNFYSAGKTAGRPSRAYMFIKEGTHFHKLHFDEILYLESDHVYVNIFTEQKKYLVRTSLQQYMEELDENTFIRIHRGYIVNKHKIDSVAPAQLNIGNKVLPISKKYRDQLLQQL
ncbi:MAG: response regulator [Bacteroidetes bacterium]|nr:response regulator [Bacteroidota bacterium]